MVKQNLVHLSILCQYDIQSTKILIVTNTNFFVMNKWTKKALENNHLIKNAEKVAFVSDMHLGLADNADESLNVQHIIFWALKYYLRNNYTVVLLGDNWELAESHNIEKIKSAHDDIMWVLGELSNFNQLIIVRGNHDYKLNIDNFLTRTSQYDGKVVPFLREDTPIVDSVSFNNIIAMHGHQYFFQYNGIMNKILVWFGPLWKWYQLHFKDFHISEHTGWQDANKCQEYFNSLGKELDKIFIIGHTHKTCFVLDHMRDTGSFGCMPRCSTAVEVTSDGIETIKFAEQADDNGRISIVRTKIDYIE